ncbi:hypothetical protein KUTeg_009588 [Tegillarca granosa]|uniref:Major facilitator superfamily (MFS) profile domain-containing protein n=1 Tax=Tegillarca granosa TaxID=220873 RepID=A0ABQ9F4B5_TEGGR|nr:hypothetical protein KUTeg_009588 [Tegillarca granosa]
MFLILDDNWMICMDTKMRLKLDSLLAELGSPGRYQICLFLLLALNYFPVVFNLIIMAFFGSMPPHTCINNRYENPDQVKVWSKNLNRSTSKQYSAVFGRNVSISGATYGKCMSVYHFDNGENETFNCQQQESADWRFKTGPRETTIVTEWDLVCENAYLGKLATTIYFCGVMVGGLLCGYLADKFGRRPVMLASLYLPILIGLGTAFANSYTLFVSLRFFQGICMQGLQTSTYVMVMELSLPQYRGIAGALLECYWGATVIITGGVAYLLQTWRHIQLAIALPSIITVVCARIIKMVDHDK